MRITAPLEICITSRATENSIHHYEVALGIASTLNWIGQSFQPSDGVSRRGRGFDEANPEALYAFGGKLRVMNDAGGHRRLELDNLITLMIQMTGVSSLKHCCSSGMFIPYSVLRI